MQPQATPATFNLITLSHAHMGRVIFPSRTPGAATTVLEQPDIPPNDSFSLFYFQTVNMMTCNLKYPHQALFGHFLGFRPGWLGLRLGWLDQRGERTDGRMYIRKISPFYRTSSPIRAAAQKQQQQPQQLTHLETHKSDESLLKLIQKILALFAPRRSSCI